MSAAEDILVGKVLASTYRLTKRIGAGSMGVVFAAEHLRLGKPVAVKVLRATDLPSGELLSRFEREARVTSALNHPNIIQIIDFNQTPNGNPFIVMERLVGEDLASLLQREETLSIADVALILRQVADALFAAHGAGVVHRDLKPSNIYLCGSTLRSTSVKLLDFGMSKVLGSRADVTASSTTLGTPQYMAPEQASGNASQVDGKADIFALGAILYRCLAGRTPFAGNSVPEVLYNVVFSDPPRVTALRKDIPMEIANVVHRALEKSAASRYADAQLFWQAFAKAAAVDVGEPFDGATKPEREPSIKLALQPDHADDVPTVANVDVAMQRPNTPIGAQDSQLSRVPINKRLFLLTPLILLLGLSVFWLATNGSVEQESLAEQRVVAPPALADAALRTSEQPQATQTSTPRASHSDAAPPADQESQATQPSAAGATPADAAPPVSPDSPATSSDPRKRTGTSSAASRRSRKKARRTRRAKRKKRQQVAETRPIEKTSTSSAGDSSTELATLALVTTDGVRPVWGTVYIDGEAIGQSPLFRKIEAGQHRLEIRRVGYQPIRRTIRLRSGESKRLTLKMVKQ